WDERLGPRVGRWAMADAAAGSGPLEAWTRISAGLTWDEPWTELYRPDPPYGRWFLGGRLNLSVNCVDRHLQTRADQAAIHWEGEPGDRRSLTYPQLHDEVCALAGALRGLGVGIGDRVALHLGWLPETVVAMLACARVGALHTLVPTPLPVEALAERLDDFRPKVLMTQDGAWRHGTILPLKARADDALAAAGGVEHTVVVRRTGVDVAWYEGDRWLHDLVAGARPGGPVPDSEAAAVPAEHTVVAANLANRRGRPVVVLHGTANLLATAAAIHRHALSPGGVFWCAGDLAWIGAQAHGVYGPLAWGDTAVMYEGMLDVPTRSRAWDIVARYHVATMLTSPSVVRRLRGWAHRSPASEAVSSLRRVVVMGEPMQPDLVSWLTDDVGRGSISVGDGWGQVELAGIVRVDRPVEPDLVPDPDLEIVDDSGRPVADGVAGELVLRRPWPGTLRTLEGPGAPDTARHWSRHPSAYATGDRAIRTPDGDLAFLGRIDEVVSVSGQLVSLSEVREVLLEHPFVGAAEVVERSDPRLGRSLAAAVVLTDGVPGDAVLARELLDTVREVMGGLARPRALAVVDRFGDELSPAQRRAALTVLLAGADEEPLQLHWPQVVAAARSTGRSQPP
ncbi:MAG: AMP-binding protein, partial [Actinomycetes bacterium]